MGPFLATEPYREERGSWSPGQYQAALPFFYSQRLLKIKDFHHSYNNILFDFIYDISILNFVDQQGGWDIVGILVAALCLGGISVIITSRILLVLINFDLEISLVQVALPLWLLKG